MCSRNFVFHNPPTPTYYPPQTRAAFPSTIDIVITNNIHVMSQMTSLPVLSSDHNPVEFEIQTSTYYLPQSILRYDLANWRNVQTYISQHINLNNTIRNEREIDLSISNLTDVIQNAIEKYVPKRTHKCKKITLPHGTINKITHRNTIRRQW